ncbi:MAG: 3-isopropylmalate dehydratase small subunit [Candidatus Odinarchaeia archaeon]
MKFKGKVWKFGDDINTDVIIAGKRLLSLDFDEIAKYAFEAIDPDFSKKVNVGDIIVAGDNFGCGSSREQAPLVIKKLGISVVIANYFARIFFRNAINIGLPVIEAPSISSKIKEGDIIEVDLSEGIILNTSTNEIIRFHNIPAFMMEILSSGGVVSYLQKNNGFKL